MNRHDHPAEPEVPDMSYVALLFILGFAVASIWLVEAFRANRRTRECLESGRSGCVQIDTSFVEPRRSP
jgi:hypothetical protein